jgi:hypothetical protein
VLQQQVAQAQAQAQAASAKAAAAAAAAACGRPQAGSAAGLPAADSEQVSCWGRRSPFLWCVNGRAQQHSEVDMRGAIDTLLATCPIAPKPHQLPPKTSLAAACRDADPLVAALHACAARWRSCRGRWRGCRTRWSC